MTALVALLTADSTARAVLPTSLQSRGLMAPAWNGETARRSHGEVQIERLEETESINIEKNNCVRMILRGFCGFALSPSLEPRWHANFLCIPSDTGKNRDPHMRLNMKPRLGLRIMPGPHPMTLISATLVSFCQKSP